MKVAVEALEVSTSRCASNYCARVSVFSVPCGLVARISGSHPGGRGSIPRTGVLKKRFITECHRKGCELHSYFPLKETMTTSNFK